MGKKTSIPFKYIVFSALCVLFFIIYWIVLCPSIWYKFNDAYLKYYVTTWTPLWPVYYWLTALLIFILILIICLWQYSTFNNRKNKKIELIEDAPGYRIVLGKDTFKEENFMNNKIDQNNRELSKISCDYKTVVQQPEQDVELYRQRSLKNQNVVVAMHDASPTQEDKHARAKKKIDECDSSKRIKPNLKPLNIPKENEQSALSKTPVESVEMRNRPNKKIIYDTDIFLKNERYMMDLENTRASLAKERFNDYLHLVEITTPFSPDTHMDHFQQKSPLTPREIFFKDLIENANSVPGQRSSAHYPPRVVLWSDNFNKRATLGSFKTIDPEKRPSFDPKKGCTLPANVEKMKTDQNADGGKRKRTSSSEYFIANVPMKKSETSQAFLFVSGDDCEKTATQITETICVDTDEVFTDNK